MAAFEKKIFFGGVVGSENVACPLQDSPFFSDGKKKCSFFLFIYHHCRALFFQLLLPIQVKGLHRGLVQG